jgi:catechol 2,3-dioxygenase-like lactoylglutathione lyase family enzyme
MVSATRMVTVGVSSLDEGLRLFGDVMELQEDWRGPLDRSLLTAWGLSDTTTARAAEFSAKGYPYGRLRIAEFTPTSSVRVRVDDGKDATDSTLDIGPKAIDFYVTDPIAKAYGRLLAAGYPARSVPRRHEIGTAISEEVLFTGPDDLPILIMVGHKHPTTSLRIGSPEGDFSDIATCSVIAGDLAASRHFYGDLLGLVPVNDAETGDAFRDLVCDLVGAPPGTRVHFLLYAEPGEASGKILLIHFYDRSGKRLVDRMRPGHLGFSLFSHDCTGIDGFHARLVQAGAQIVTPPTNVERPDGAARIMLVKGPNEEMFEFVDRG